MGLLCVMEVRLTALQILDTKSLIFGLCHMNRLS